MGADVGDLDLEDRVTTLASEHLACLVGSDAHQPRPKAFWIPQGTHLPPRDRPSGLDGILGQVRIATDDVAEAGHVVVMSTHDARERVRITRRRLRHGRCRDAP